MNAEITKTNFAVIAKTYQLSSVDDWAVIKLNVVSYEDGVVRNPSDYEEDPMDHLLINGYYSHDNKFWGIKLCYSDIYCEDLKILERRVKFLRKIERRAAKLIESHIDRNTSAIINSYLRALGIEDILITYDTSSEYDKNRYECYDRFHGLAIVEGDAMRLTE